MNKIAAVVVTFNRLNMLKECIASLQEQTKKIDLIVVVNNGSTDRTKVWLDNQRDLFVIHQDNLGGAGGFHTGLKQGYEMGFEWLWVMDDDCIANVDCLNQMFVSLNSQKIYCVAPVVINRYNKIDINHRGFFNLSNKSKAIQTPVAQLYEKDILVDFSSFVGLMINSFAIEKIGLPMKELFIHNDDVEYCLRLTKISKILLCMNAKIYHLENTTSLDIKRTFLKHTKNRPQINRLWIKYYGVRNLIWIKKTYIANHSKLKKIQLIIFIVKALLIDIKDILLYDDFKYKRIRFYFSAYKDGWFGKFDNDVPKRILSQHIY